ncbi:MAG: translation elongation factor Ts [Planctomycetota bacterium]|jgi:elongation factor Ts
MSIDAKLVAELRKRTGLPMMKCKAALVEAGGDIEAATDALRKQGVKAADKVASRELKEGRVFLHQSEAGACAVSLMCQTDFVAKNDEVVAFGEQLSKDLFDNAPADQGDGESLADFALADGRTVKQIHEDFALKIRENIQVGSYARFKPQNGIVSTYVHHNEKIACLVEFDGDNLNNSDAVAELGRDLGMQLAFHSDVRALTRDELDQDWVAKEREIFVAQAAEMPEDKRAMIAEGKLSKRLKDVVLLEQPFIKDEKVSVEKRVAAVGSDAGVSLALKRFARIGAGA